MGQPLAEIGDLGDVKSCALGIAIQSRAAQKDPKELDPVEFLTRRGAAVPDAPR